MKATLISQIRELLVPDNRPATLVFRSTKGGLYTHEGRELTKEQCESMPCKMRIFVNHIKTPVPNGKQE